MRNSNRDWAVGEMRLVVATEDLEEAVRFYRDALGLPEVLVVESEGGARAVILDAGRATLELINPAQRSLIDDIEVGRPVSRNIRVAFGVEDAPGKTSELSGAGAVLVADPAITPWGSLNSRLEAPAGLQITLFQELAAEQVR